MQYLALIYGDEVAGRALSPRSASASMGEYMALSRGGASTLGAATSSTRPRLRRPSASASDETLVTDGPYAEVKEALGGYYILECDSIDEAWTGRRRSRPPSTARSRCARLRRRR